MDTKLDSRRLRETLGHCPTAVALITAMDDAGEPVGMVVGSFTSVSLDPPLVAYLPTITSGRYARLRTAEIFCVNVLSAAQEDVCRHFAGGEATFDKITWSLSPGGAPIVDESVAWIECEVHSVQELGDHYLVVGQVRDLSPQAPEAPLVFFQGGYGRFSGVSLVAAPDTKLIESVRTAEIARPYLEEISNRLSVGCEVIVQAGNDLVYVAAAGSVPSLVGSSLGMRVPLIAPLGEQVAAWNEPAFQEGWLNRGGITDADARAEWLGRLGQARERGWSLSLVKRDNEVEFYRALREFAQGDVTPARERAVKATIAEMSATYEPVELESGQTYDIRSIVVPVLGDGDHPSLYLRLVDLPLGSEAATIVSWIRDLQQTAAAVARSVSKP